MSCVGWQLCFLENRRCLYGFLCTDTNFVGAAFDADHKLCCLHNKRNIRNTIKPSIISSFQYQIQLKKYQTSQCYSIRYLHNLIIFIIMKRVQLYERVQSTKAASQFQHSLIDSIYNIMQLKRKAEWDYRTNLQSINRELQRYILQDNGFLTDIVKAFQSYVTVLYHNQSSLIEGYDNEILNFLQQAKIPTTENELVDRVKFFDGKFTQSLEKIRNLKQVIRDNETEIQVINSEVKLGQRIGTIKEEQMRKFAQKYNDLRGLKQANEDRLEAQVDGMMELTMSHNELLRDLQQYQSVQLQQKGSEVFDHFMRAFVLEVSFIRSMQFDVGGILQRVKEHQEQHKKVALDALRAKMGTVTSKMTAFLKDAYKKVSGSFLIDINEKYISERVRGKWSRVCEYYNEAF